MSIRWAVMLPFLHVCLSLIWIWQHDARYWRDLATLQKIEDYYRSHPAPSTGTAENEVDFAMESEYRPPLEVKAIIGVDPVPILLAGFDFPFTAKGGRGKPMSAPLLLPLANHLRLKSRIVALHTFLAILVGLQWWLLGRHLDLSPDVRFGKELKRPALQITALAMLIGALSLIYQLRESGNVELVGSLCSVFALIIWFSWGVTVAARFAIRFRRGVRFSR